MQESFKARVCRVINDCAGIFKKTFIDYEYLVCSKSFDCGYHIVKAHEGNFLHLTGVHTYLTPKRFFEKALHNELTVNDFDFRKVGVSEASVKGSVREKIIALPKIDDFFRQQLSVESNFVRNSISCSFASSNQQGMITIGFVENGNPKSLMKGFKLHPEQHHDVVLVLRKEPKDEDYGRIIWGDMNALKEYWPQISESVSEDIYCVNDIGE